MRRVVLCCALVGCGRLHFDARDDGGASGDGDDAITCEATNAPDPLTISGRTFRYTSFDNSNSAPLAGVTVIAYDPGTASTLGTATSNAAGDYSISVATGGAPKAVALAYSLTGYYTSTLTMDFLLDRDYAGAFVPVWRVGDGPLWNSTQMTMIYNTVGVTRDIARSTVNIAVRDCAGQPLEGATVSMNPPPELLVYQASDGTPGIDPTTVAPFAHALAFNASGTLTTFTASAPGMTFPALTFVLQPGSFNHLVVMRASPP